MENNELYAKKKVLWEQHEKKCEEFNVVVSKNSAIWRKYSTGEFITTEELDILKQESQIINDLDQILKEISEINEHLFQN